MTQRHPQNRAPGPAPIQSSSPTQAPPAILLLGEEDIFRDPFSDFAPSSR